MNGGTYLSQPGRRSWLRWHEWLVLILLALLVFGQYVVRPLGERLVRGVGGIVSSIALGAATLAEAAYRTAAIEIESDPQVAALLGGPVFCAPLEQVTWHESRVGDTLEFSVTVTSTAGATGVAHVVTRFDDIGMHVDSITVAGERDCVRVPIH